MESCDCTIDGTCYKTRSRVCDDKRCYECRDGQWREKSTLDLMAEALEKR
jgi:hypothetical protein